MYRIFIVEDDEKICGVMKREMEKWEYGVTAVRDFNAILDEFIACQPHLVLLDINLPSRDGFYWCQKIRENSTVPVIFMSSRDSSMDIVMAVGMGGDDYITKPFSLDVMMAKINAVIRRTYAYKESAPETLEYNGAALNLVDSTLHFQGNQAELTRNEFKILSLLMRNAGTIVSRDQIMRELWEDESFIDDNTLTVNVNRLRKSLSDVGLTDFITTVKSQGYEIK